MLATPSASSGVPITSLDSHADKTGIDTIAPLLVKQKKDADIRDKEIYSERGMLLAIFLTS